MPHRFHRTRRLAAVAGGVSVLLAVAAPALAATTVNESLSNFKITGGSSAKAGSVTFKVKNATKIGHELVVIKTNTKAAKLKVSGGKASEKGKVGEVEVSGGKTKTLKLNLKKGHYALICNVGDHYMEGMHMDFTVK
jgi:uncharacterized cupredoxin-like copper-binding protein